MFYSQFILAKKGPLGTIWIAAHLERKLRKNQVADTDIGVSVDSILFPEMPIALRLSSHLLLGVVRIYSKKVNYLFDDCSEALLKVKQAFRSTAVDLPPEESTAPYHSITLPETFDLDDFELPDNDLQGNYVDQHISSKDQITLQDTMEGIVYSTSKFGLDERFGDGDASGLDLDEELLVEKAATPELATGALNSDDPQVSGHADDSGILNEDLDEYDGDNEPVDYAQAPCTPGLWEEPNLANIQETSACDDHQEPENHAITESAVKENLENVFPREQHHNPFESHEEPPPSASETEQVLIHDLGSTPFTELHSSETAILVSNNPANVDDLLNTNVRNEDPGFQTASDNHENFIKYQGNQDPGVQTSNDQHGNFVECQGNQESTFHLTTELESNIGKDNLVGTPEHHTSLEPKESTTPVLFPHESMPNSNLPSLRPCITFPNHEIDAEGPHATEALNKTFPEIPRAQFDQNHQVRVDNVIHREGHVESINSYANDFSAPVTQREVQVENINSYANDFSAPVTQKEVQVENINSYANDFSAPVIQKEVQVENINSYANDFSAPVTQREVQVENINSYANDFSAPVTQKEVQVENINSYANDFSAPVTQREVQVENINSYANDFSAPVTQREVQVENINSYANDHPAPEKRLSLPHWLSDVPKNFVPESTPIEKDITPGAKRSFTESSMTDQSLNLNESSGLFNPNTTPQSLNLNASSSFYTTNVTPQSLNLNQSSGIFTTNTTAQSLNSNQSSGFFVTNTTAPSLNSNQSSGFFTTNTPAQSLNTTAQSLNLNQSSGFFTTNTSAPSLNLNQSSGFFTTNTPGQSQNTTSQSLNLNQSSGFFTTNTTPQSLNLNQSSGFFTTNKTAQSLNLNQSSGPFTIDTTGQSAANDADLLSSILVGRKSSILKTKPSPPVATPSTKRRRATAPKTGVPKRKVLMDDNMVLHGDTIRQQLINTEDIRRLRKKAPCTRSEISMLEKQFWEDDIFSEPIFSGVSIKLASLHNQLYNLSKIVVSHNDALLEGGKEPTSISQNDEKDKQLEVGPSIPKQNAQNDGKDKQLEVGPNVPKENVDFGPVAQPIEPPMVTDNHTRDNNTGGLDLSESQPPQTAATEHVAEPFNSKHDLFGERTAMEIDPKSFPDAEVGVPVMPTVVEPPTHAVEIDPKSFRDAEVGVPVMPTVVEPPTHAVEIDPKSFPDAEVGVPVMPTVVEPSTHAVEINPKSFPDADTGVPVMPTEVEPPTHAVEINSKSFPDADIGVPVMPTEVEPPTHAVEINPKSFPDADIGVAVMPTEVEPPTHAMEIDPKSFPDADVGVPVMPTEVEPPTHAMEIDPKSFPDADDGVPAMPTEVEPPTHADLAPSDTFDMPSAMNEVQVDASLQTDAPGVDSTEKMDLHPGDMDINSFKSLESNIASETNIDVAPVKEVSKEKHDQDIEYGKNEEGIVDQDAALASKVESNIQNSVYNGIFGEEFGTAAAYDTEVNPVLENVPLDERENPGHDVTFETTEMNVEDLPAHNRVDDDAKVTRPATENNTDFLNFDDADDDGADAGGEYAPDVEATQAIDNSGWSSRTKAVAKYLQIMFAKEGERGRNMLAVNNLLVGKTRKEASRMFFETLVLKTKDYIHVEQADPFENINIFPRAKLLKSDF